MRAGRRLAALPTLLVAASLALAACSSSPHPAASSGGSGHGGAGSTSITAAPPYPASTTLPLARTTGALQVYAKIPLPISNGQVAATESPDGAVFAAPISFGGTATTVVYVIDGNSPAAVAETFPGPVTALAADSTNLYVANYTDVTAFNRASGNQSGQWALPPISTANASDDDLTTLSASGGSVLISIVQGNQVSVYRIDPDAATAPQLVVQGMSAAFGPDGSVVYERADHHLVDLSASGTSVVGPVLADAPNSEGGGVQFVDAVVGGFVWVSEPAGQGLDAQLATFDLQTLRQVATFDATANEQVVGTTGGTLALNSPYNAAVCPNATPTSECIERLSSTGTLSDGTLAGATLQLLGPDPAVVAAAPSNTSLLLERLS
jgi:hypothetical protein